jgi:hypothetical protein
VVEAVSAGGSQYAKRVYYLRKSDCSAARIEFYTRGYRGPQLKLTRTVKSADVEEWVAAGTGEKTVIRISNRNSGAPEAGQFTVEALKSDPGLIRLMKERGKLLEEESRLKRENAALRAEVEKLKAGK